MIAMGSSGAWITGAIVGRLSGGHFQRRLSGRARWCDRGRRGRQASSRCRWGSKKGNHQQILPPCHPMRHLWDPDLTDACPKMLLRRLSNSSRAAAVSLHARALCTSSKTLGTPRENWAEVCRCQSNQQPHECLLLLLLSDMDVSHSSLPPPTHHSSATRRGARRSCK